MRSDKGNHFLHVASGQTLELVNGKLTLNVNASLRAAVRQSCQRALPAHPHRQCCYLAHCYRRSKTGTTLCRSHCERMLYSVTLEDPRRAIIHTDWNGDADGALRKFQSITQI